MIVGRFHLIGLSSGIHQEILAEKDTLRFQCGDSPCNVWTPKSGIVIPASKPFGKLFPNQFVSMRMGEKVFKGGLDVGKEVLVVLFGGGIVQAFDVIEMFRYKAAGFVIILLLLLFSNNHNLRKGGKLWLS